MTQSEFKAFLTEGALLRPSGSNRFYLFLDPQDSASQKPVEKTLKNTVFVQDFYSAEIHEFSYQRVITLAKAELQKLCLSLLEVELPQKDFWQGWQEPDYQAFVQTFTQIQTAFHENSMYKAVPVVFAHKAQKPLISDLAKMLFQLCTMPESLHIYGYWNSNAGIIGATPELLFSLEGNELRSMALAGTCPKKDIATRIPLLEDAKEMKEHNIVVEDIHTQLKRFGSVKVGKTHILELPTLLHLKTDMIVSVENTPQYSELIRALHPTPALGIAPRSLGLDTLKKFESSWERQYYGAPLGFSFDAQNFLSLVAIRNLQWNKKYSFIGSGCGIVPESQLDKEWQELAAKRHSVKNALGALI